MSTYLGFDYHVHQSARGGIRRPVEDYVLARITIQEHLAKLTEEQRRAVVMGACGFTMTDWAEVRGINRNTASITRRQGMETLAKEEPPPVMCEDCGEREATIKGMCKRCDNRRRRRLAGIMPKVKVVKPPKEPRQPKSIVMCGVCERKPATKKGKCDNCYSKAHYRMYHPKRKRGSKRR